MSIHNPEWPVIYDKAQAEHLAVKFNNKYWFISGNMNNQIILNEVSDSAVGILQAKQKTIPMQEWLKYARKGLYSYIPRNKLIKINENFFIMKIN